MMRYLYKEMTPDESNEFLSQINEQPDLQEQFTHLKEGFEKLDDIQYSPSPSVIDRIMQYGSAVEEAHSKK